MKIVNFSVWNDWSENLGQSVMGSEGAEQWEPNIQGKGVGLYPEDNEEPQMSFKQQSDVARFLIFVIWT